MTRGTRFCWPAARAQLGTLTLWASALHDLWLDGTAHLNQTEFNTLYRQVRRYTMCGYPRLKSLYDAIQHVTSQGISGALVECGTARGGSAALMGLAARRLAVERPLWVFDTFAGLPPPTHEDPDFDIAVRYTGQCRGEVHEVQALLARLGLSAQARLIPGLFAATLPTAATGPIAVLHLDCDWYESVRVSLDHLYPRVVPGGVIQIDDYGRWQGARRAVDEFLAAQAVRAPLHRVDYNARRWVKPSGA